MTTFGLRNRIRKMALPLGTGSVPKGLMAAACVGMLSLAGCSNPASGASSSGGGTLSMGINIQIPTGLNPALWTPGTSNPYFEAAYDSLLYLDANGQAKPDLATSWGYKNGDPLEFDITLRDGVKFTDGSPLTPQSVADSLMYYKNAGGSAASNMAAVSSVQVTGANTLAIHLSQDNPDLVWLLSQNGLAGDIVGPQGIKDPSSLKTKTDGTGPYVLDPSQTTALQTYTYTKNPSYWNAASVHYSKFVLKVITDANAMLSALQSNQIQAGIGTSATTDAAKRAGLNVLSAPSRVVTAVIGDRSGTVAKPLASLQVRQALNLALDRSSMSSSILGAASKPTDEPFTPGSPAFDPQSQSLYPYDISKAKQLLAGAGYGSGFELPVACFSAEPEWCQAAQILQSQWAQLGVTVKISQFSTPAAYTPAVSSKQFPVSFITTGSGSPYLALNSLAKGVMTNPWHLQDPEYQKLMTAAAAAPSDQAAQAEQAVTNYIVNQAWYVPIGTDNNSYFLNKNIKNAGISAGNPFVDPFGPTSDGSWS